MAVPLAQKGDKMKRSILFTMLGLIALCGMVTDVSGQTTGNAPPTVTVDEISCFSDWRFYAGWQTTKTASWPLVYKWKANRLDVEVRAQFGQYWLTVERVPFAAQSVDVSQLGDVRFYLVDRRNGKERKLNVNPGMIVQCTYLPPPEGSAWVWKAGEGFILAEVDVIGWVE